MLTRWHTPKAPFSSSAFRTLDQRRPGRITQRMTKNMADDDERSRRKANPGQNKKPYWHETCIGVWTKSIKGHHVNSEADQDKICNGISVVRIYGKTYANHGLSPTDDSNVKLSKTRGLQIIICIDSEHQHPPPKPHDHTYISVERVEADDNEEKTANAETDPTKEQMPSLTRRVMDIMLMKKTNMEKNVEHFKSNGIKLTDVWDGVYGTCSKCYETTARLVSYCHPVEKVTQMYGFVANRIKNAGKWTNEDESKRKK